MTTAIPMTMRACHGFTDSGDKITFARNIFGQITERTDPAGYRLGFRYDRFGRPKVLVNEKTNLTGLNMTHCTA